MITELTPQQWEEMRVFREEQRRLALRTDRVEQPKVRESVNNLYQGVIGKQPKYIFVMQSPLQCLLAKALVARFMPKSFWDKKDPTGWDDDKLLPGTELWHSFQRQMVAQFRHYPDLAPFVNGGFRDALAALYKEVKAKGTSSLYETLYFLGGLDNAGLAFYEFGARIGVKFEKKTWDHLVLYREYASNCGVAWFYDGAAFVADRPNAIIFDAQRRLHNLEGPAISWEDGFAIYNWRGVHIPKWLIEERMTMSPKKIMEVSNAEIRRAGMEIYSQTHGSEKFVSDMGAKLVSEDMNQGFPRKLYAVGNEKFVEVKNGSLEPDGSRKTYFLGVADEMQTPHDAIAASYGIPPKKYKEAVRT